MTEPVERYFLLSRDGSSVEVTREEWEAAEGAPWSEWPKPESGDDDV